MTTPTPIFPQAINVGLITVANSDAQAYKTVFTAGTNGSKIESLTVSSTDTSNRDITVNITRSAVNYQLTQVSIPLSSGALNTAPAIDILRNAQFPGLAYDSNGNKYLYLKSGDTLTVNAPITVTTAKLITVVASGGDF